ncbi:unnamed protein product [Lathyrus sativus]|nr:unnamed protein product [Lathyrus sativus]
MGSSLNPRVPHVLQPKQSNTLSLNDCLTIFIDYTHLSISSASNDPKDLTFKLKTPVFKKFEIPCEILCNNNDINNQFLYETFDVIPSNLIGAAIRNLKDCARQMVLDGKLEEMRMRFRKVSSHIPKKDEYDQNHDNDQQIVGLSSNLKVDVTLDSKDRCSICFEEFCNGSQTELFYTKCSHIFHKLCIAEWIFQCVDHARDYPCPLCRCDIV